MHKSEWKDWLKGFKVVVEKWCGGANMCLIWEVETVSKPMKVVWQNNAWWNDQAAWKLNIHFEYTAKETPQ